MLRALAAREVFGGRAALVVAHPDDETIAAGGSLHLLPGVLLVHVTDGAPRRLGDAARSGFDTPAAYAAAREAELQAALALVPLTDANSVMPGLDPGIHAVPHVLRPPVGRSLDASQYALDAVDTRVKPGHDGVETVYTHPGPTRLQFGIPDQDAALHLRILTQTLAALFKIHAIDAVLTHAYEGGHPDHDATALAVHRAAAGIPVFEFAGYHAAPGRTVMQRFLPGPPEAMIALPPADAARKRAMLACFRTQAEILSRFDPGIERFRPAPAHDFTAAPHPGALNYEAWGWELTGARWRTLAAQELQCAA